MYFILAICNNVCAVCKYTCAFSKYTSLQTSKNYAHEIYSYENKTGTTNLNELIQYGPAPRLILSMVFFVAPMICIFRGHFHFALSHVVNKMHNFHSLCTVQCSSVQYSTARCACKMNPQTTKQCVCSTAHNLQ